MKMTSKTTSHKTDVGGVRVNIQSVEELKAQYQDLIAKLKAKGILEGLEGVIIQEMVKGNREMVCGVAKDPQYGPMIMFGLGGVFVEVLKDVSFRSRPSPTSTRTTWCAPLRPISYLKAPAAQHPPISPRSKKPFSGFRSLSPTSRRLKNLTSIR